MHKRFHLFIIIISITLLSILFSLIKGSISINLDQLLSTQSQLIFLKLRLPRVLSAFSCGGLLALAGVLMQILLENPLADPYVLGVSSGAAFFTLLMMLLGLSEYWLIGGAWIGSLLTISMMLLFAKKHRFQAHALLLSGIVLACGFSACVSFVLLISPANNLPGMLFWLMGDLNGAQHPEASLIILMIGLLLCLLLAPGLNILGRGEKEAKALGLPTTTYRCTLYLLSSLFTASAVSLAGCIGFIGLLVPHFSRILCGYDHRIILPVSLLLGGSLLTVADTFARSLFAPQQLPVGILISLIGVPVFILLLQKHERL